MLRCFSLGNKCMIISFLHFWCVFYVSSKTCWQQNIFLLKATEGFAVLHHHQTRKLLLSLHWSLTQCSSAELCCRTQEGKAQLLLKGHCLLKTQYLEFPVQSHETHSSPCTACPMEGTCWLLHLLGLYNTSEQGGGRWSHGEICPTVIWCLF